MRWLAVLGALGALVGCGRIGFDPGTGDAGPDGGEAGTAACIEELAIGDDHACVRLDDGGVWCWGLNDQGQVATPPITNLGDPPLAPARVLDGPYAHIHTGDNHVCAIRRADRGVACWGSAGNSALGPGSNLDTPNAVTVPGLVAEELFVGGSTSCAREGQAVSCWGDGDGGQLGDGTLDDQRALPGPVPLVVTIGGMGADHACMGTGSSLSCWGINGHGQLGFDPILSPATCTDKDSVSQLCNAAPAAVAAFPAALVTVAFGDRHTCALDAAGDVWCWGDGARGQLGDGTLAPRSAPARVPNLPPVRALASGQETTCVVLTDATVRCWGDNVDGQLGDGSAATLRSTPGVVPGLAGVRLLGSTTSSDTLCALTDAELWCWGENDGVIATSTELFVATPRSVLPRCP